MNRTFLIGLALVFIAGGVLSISTATAIFNRKNRRAKVPTLVYEHGDWRQQAYLKDFILTDQEGQKFRSEKMKDQVCVVSFFFAMCPSVCSMQNEKVAELQTQMKKVQFISITCDPKNDTPDALKKYAAKYTENTKTWSFLTGELEHIRRIGAEVFGVAVNKATHTSHLLLVDKWGKVRGRYVFSNAEQVEQLKKEVEKLKKETEPPPPPKKKKRRKPNIRLDDDDLDDDDDDDDASKKKATKAASKKKSEPKKSVKQKRKQ